MEHPEHTLSWQAIGRVVLTGIAILLAWMASGAFVDILIALVIAVSLYTAVAWMNRSLHIPHLASVFAVLVLILVPFVVLAFLITPLMQQAPALMTSLLAALTPLGILPRSVSNFNIAVYMQTHTDALLASGATALLLGLSAITVLILSFYFIYDYERLSELFLDLFPEVEQARLRLLLGEIADVTGRYVRGNVLISLICIVVVGTGLLLLHLPYALPLALFAGVLDLLPLVGSTVGAIPAVIIAFGISPLTGVLVVVLYVTYQQIESAFISPLIYNKALNISSALTFLSVIVGASLFGILGAFLALPVAASIPVLVRYQKSYARRHAVRES